MKAFQILAAIVGVLFVCAFAGCGNPCAKALERAQTCHEELCGEGGEGHPLCDEEFSEIAECSDTAKAAAQRSVDAEDCNRAMNLYSTASALAGAE